MTRPAVLVTGGAKRVGAEISRRFAASGWHVVIHYSQAETQAAALAEELPFAQTIRCDLADVEASKAMINQLANQLDDWRCLVSNASVFALDTVTALDPATNKEAMQVNAVTPALIAQAFLASARSKKGRSVIQLTDQKLANPNPDFFSYTMSKAAADSAAQMLAMATAPGDRVLRLAPGAILPSHDQSESEAEASHRLNLLHRRTDVMEVAEAAVFMAEGPLANGQVLYIDSGQHLLRQPRDVIFLEREGEV